MKLFSTLSSPNIHITTIDDIKPIKELNKKVKNVVSVYLYINTGITSDNPATGIKGNITLNRQVDAGKALSCFRIITLTNKPTIAKATESIKVLYTGIPILYRAYVKIKLAKNIMDIAIW